ncbi:MAG: TraM recognition domain-containing protein [Planctomycetota bacterium]|jgi:hypothetical protein
MREPPRQLVGNPIQIDRLPDRRPRIVFSPHASDVDGNPEFAAQNVLRWLARLSLLSVLASIVWLPTALVGSGPGFFWLFLILAYLVIWLMRTAATFQRPWGWIPVLSLAVVFFWVFTPLPWTTHLFLYAVALSLLIWSFGVHWIELHLTWPIQPEAANQLRERWKGYLVVMACVPLLGFLVYALTGQVIAAVLLPLLAVLINVVSGLSHDFTGTNSLVTSAVVSWLERDPHDSRGPGIVARLRGRFVQRFVATGSVVVLTAASLVRIPLQWVASSDPDAAEHVASALFMFVPGYGFALTPLSLVLWTVAAMFALLLPMLAAVLTPPLLLLPLLREVQSTHVGEVKPPQWKNVVRSIQCSTDPVERRSLYMGRIQSDGSPLLIPREVFHEHGHFLGDSGSGKTSMGLAPWLEQIITGDDCSVIVIDLKADSHELLATLSAAARDRSQITGRPVPIKHFSNQATLSSFACNPMMQPYWLSMDPYVRTDILCAALGLNYGSDYGEGYYSSANAAVVYQTLRSYPDTKTFRDLAERVRYVSSNAKKGGDLNPEIGKAGVHVQTVLDRLGTFEPLNVTPETHSEEIVSSAIDFRDVFREPQVHYFHLSATLAPGSSPEIARLVAYSLLAAATQAERRHQVFLVIDEFQRMVAGSIEYMLQLARSMGVGVLIANQTMQDLKTSRRDLIPIIDANCRYRQWFGISSNEDRKRLIEASGETLQIERSESVSRSTRDISQTRSLRHSTVNRFGVNDLLLATDNTNSSIVRISRGAGYAQFGGLPLIAESSYHITEAEFNRRKSFPWPAPGGGAFIPAENDTTTPESPRAQRPPVTTEVIGDDCDVVDPFESWHRDRDSQRPKSGPRKKRSSKRRPQKRED